VQDALQQSLAAFQEDQSNLEQFQKEHLLLKAEALEIAKHLQVKRAKQVTCLGEGNKRIVVEGWNAKCNI